MNLKNLKPIYVENSKIPTILSRVAPIDIWAIALGPFVFCRGILSDPVKRHETIHFQQQLECLFLGQWFLYIVFYLIGIVRTGDGRRSYMNIPFEREAYRNEMDEDYLNKRKRFSWLKYMWR